MYNTAASIRYKICIDCVPGKTCKLRHNVLLSKKVLLICMHITIFTHSSSNFHKPKRYIYRSRFCLTLLACNDIPLQWAILLDDSLLYIYLLAEKLQYKNCRMTRKNSDKLVPCCRRIIRREWEMRRKWAIHIQCFQMTEVRSVHNAVSTRPVYKRNCLT